MEKSLIQKEYPLDLDSIETIEVVRSFSRKVQLEQYQPIEAFSSYKAILKADTSREKINQISQQLSELAKRDVWEETDRVQRETKQPF